MKINIYNVDLISGFSFGGNTIDASSLNMDGIKNDILAMVELGYTRIHIKKLGAGSYIEQHINLIDQLSGLDINIEGTLDIYFTTVCPLVLCGSPSYTILNDKGESYPKHYHGCTANEVLLSHYNVSHMSETVEEQISEIDELGESGQYAEALERLKKLEKTANLNSNELITCGYRISLYQAQHKVRDKGATI